MIRDLHGLFLQKLRQLHLVDSLERDEMIEKHYDEKNCELLT